MLYSKVEKFHGRSYLMNDDDARSNNRIETNGRIGHKKKIYKSIVKNNCIKLKNINIKLL